MHCALRSTRRAFATALILASCPCDRRALAIAVVMATGLPPRPGPLPAASHQFEAA